MTESWRRWEDRLQAAGCRLQEIEDWVARAGAAEAAPLVCLDHFGGGRASVWALGGMEIGLLFHAMISVIRGQCGAGET